MNSMWKDRIEKSTPFSNSSIFAFFVNISYVLRVIFEFASFRFPKNYPIFQNK